MCIFVQITCYCTICYLVLRFFDEIRCRPEADRCRRSSTVVIVLWWEECHGQASQSSTTKVNRPRVSGQLMTASELGCSGTGPQAVSADSRIIIIIIIRRVSLRIGELLLELYRTENLEFLE